MNAIDTNVYLYAIDADEPIKQAKAIALLDQLILQPSKTVLIWQVAAEFLSQLRRWEGQGKLPSAATEAAFNRLTSLFPLQTPTIAVFRTANCIRDSAFHIGTACS